jgi:hypothetical protein
MTILIYMEIRMHVVINHCECYLQVGEDFAINHNEKYCRAYNLLNIIDVVFKNCLLRQNYHFTFHLYFF